MSATCTCCQAPLGRSLVGSVFWLMTSPNDYPCENPNKTCSARLCSACHGKRPLMMLPNDDTTDDTTTDTKKHQDLSKASLKCLCQPCFEETSTLDFSKTYDIVQGGSNAVFVFCHGGGASRQLYHYHALELKEQFGHSSILLDLPGHGTLVDQELTLDSATQTVQSVLNECQAVTKDKMIIYVGTSLGGYIGFYILKQLNGTFHGAVQIDVGQNVGPDASFKAKAGLVMLDYMSKKMSNATLMKLMAGEMKKSTATEFHYILASTFGAGMFFDQGHAQVECLRTVAPADMLASITIPIVYMNGSADYRDSEDKWLQLTKVQEGKSELKVYEGGDHFFSHDARFLSDVLSRMDAFAKKL
ncbi:expressed unknown protein [Seminavis robusta]|uniref:AB hydrolase-1 domain-containing protein n=1 Tax=Seminavis robusta TaxID=568900 RepID=A0A9N8HGJ7_9STRA|nr:expressed unknown protein [Seminavis robusta]|eukprot:Sro401_g135270.1 n/a (359) ;mRNA; r:13584-14660